jgi:hypothetical protein
MKPSITVDCEENEGGCRYHIKIGTDSFEINVDVPVEFVDRLNLVRQTPWGSGALHIGTSAGMPAWWCVGDESEDTRILSILVGQDDETWDIAVQLPIDTVDEVLREIAECSIAANKQSEDRAR